METVPVWLVLLSLCHGLPKQTLKECQATHRTHPYTQHKFQMLDGNYWIEVDCGELVWSQVICQCTYPQHPDEKDCKNYIPGKKRGMYKMWNGMVWMELDCNSLMSKEALVWNQEKCICDWDSEESLVAKLPAKEVPVKCQLMLNLTFQTTFMDDANGSWMDRRNQKASYVTKEKDVIGGSAACFQEAPMLVPYFSGKSLSHTFMVSFYFKICEEFIADDRSQTILHNSCFIQGEGIFLPTIEVSFLSQTQTFHLLMDTEYSHGPQTDFCKANINPGKWNHVHIHYQDDRLTLSTNGYECISSQLFTGSVKQFNCPLTVPGEDYCGCLDEVVITKGCLE